MPELNYKVNLLPPKLQREEIVDVRRLLIITGVTLLIAVILGSYGVFIISFYNAKNELSAAKAQLATLNPVAARVEKMRAERVQLEQTIDEYNLILKSQKQWSDLLGDINRIMPVDLWLVGLEITYTQPEQKAAGQGSQTGAPAQKQVSGNSGAAKQPEAVPRPNAVIFKGSSRTVASIGVFINGLTRLPCFQEVRLDKVGEGTDGIQFEITAFLKGVN